MNIAKKKTFNFFRILGITALVCTIILWAGLWISSGIPSSAKALNNSIANSVDDSLDFDNTLSSTNVTSYISCGLQSTTHFIGETAKAVVYYYPQKTTDKAVEYVSSNPEAISIDQEGNIAFLSSGLTQIKVILKSNPNIYATQNVYCWGINPLGHDNTFRVDNNNTIRQYECAYSWINEDRTARHSATRYYTDDENIATVDISGIVTAKNIGSTTLRAEFANGAKLECPITVVENPDYMPLEKITLNNFKLDIATTYFRIADLIQSIEPEVGNYSPIIHVKSSNEKIVYEKLSQLVVEGYGEVTLTFYSEFNPEVKACVTTYVEPIQPTELNVSAPNHITPHIPARLTASHSPAPYTTAVEWSVISGDATISQDGVLQSSFWGNIVVRCTSTINPDMYVDTTIPSVLFTNAYYFVRKLMGHFGLSALLGFGIFFSIFLMDKRKWKAFALTPVLSFGYAGISELIQYFTPTRACTLTDVIIDFVGALIGMAVAMVIFALITLIWRLASKKTFGAYTSTLKSLNIHNARGKAYVADEYTREAPCTTAQEQPISA